MLTQIMRVRSLTCAVHLNLICKFNNIPYDVCSIITANTSMICSRRHCTCHESAQSVRVVCPCIYMYLLHWRIQRSVIGICILKLERNVMRQAKKKKDRKREKQLYSIYIWFILFFIYNVTEQDFLLTFPFEKYWINVSTLIFTCIYIVSMR